MTRKMNDEVGEFKSRFLALTAEGQALFLARVIQSLTVNVRSYLYNGESEENAMAALRNINEIIHVASSKLRDLLMATPDQFPPEVFYEILIQAAKESKGELEAAMRRAFERERV